jgi:hypothetical protein
MNQDDSRIPICSLPTSLGTWTASTDAETMKVSHKTYDFPYYLTNSQFPEFELTTRKDIYVLVRAVAQHKTGLHEWDESDEKASDYIRKWKLHFDDRLLINLVADYLRQRPDDSMRSLIDYFEHKYSYMMERMKVVDLIRQMIMSGEIKKLPSMHMAPSETYSLQRLAKKWLEDKPTDSK